METNYKQMIADILSQIDNEKHLKFLYHFIFSLKENWGY